MLCSEIKISFFHFSKTSIFLCTVLSTINGDEDKDSEDTDNEQVNCLPQLADKCFTDIYTNLACHLDPTAPPDCAKRDVKDLCR